MLVQCKDKLGFERNRLFPCLIALSQLQRVHMLRAVRRKADVLPSHRIHHRAELRFGVTDQYIIVRVQNNVHQLPFRGHALAAARHTKIKTVPVEQQLAVANDAVPADGISAIIDTAPVHHILHGKGRQRRRALCVHRAHRFNFPQAVGQCRVQALLLLEMERIETAQIAPRRGRDGLRVTVELRIAVRQMHQRHQHKHHPLVPRSQIIQQRLHFLPHLLHLIGRLRGKVVVRVLLLLPPGNIRLHGKHALLHVRHSLLHGDRDDLDGQHQILREFAQPGDRFVLEKIGIVL